MLLYLVLLAIENRVGLWLNIERSMPMHVEVLLWSCRNICKGQRVIREQAVRVVGLHLMLLAVELQSEVSVYAAIIGLSWLS